MTIRWRSNFDWPYWGDMGSLVEVDLEDQGMRQTVVGKLVADDYFFNGEDEVPIFSIHCADGSIVPFACMVRWRVVTEEEMTKP